MDPLNRITHINAFLDTLGIENAGYSIAKFPIDDVIMKLMNTALQTLGTIRHLIGIQEKRKSSVSINQNLDRSEVKGEDNESCSAIRIIFAIAVKSLLESILSGCSESDVDPAHHLLNTFPDMHSMGTSRWCPIHFAIVGQHRKHDNLTLLPRHGFNNESPGKGLDNRSSWHPTKEIETRQSCILTIARKYPSTVFELDAEGRTFLHYACRLNHTAFFETGLQVARGSIDLKFANFNGAIPLHNTARFSASVDVLNAVIEKYPEAAKTRNHELLLPLHWASAKSRSVGIIHRLIAEYPLGIYEINGEGSLPLHCAGQNTNIGIVKAVYESYPKAISLPDHDGGYPLHHACSLNPSIEVVRFLHHAYPEAMTIAQIANSLTPLHLAAYQNPSPQVIRYIIDANPTAAGAQDNDGWLPLHCLLKCDPLAFNRNRLECLRMLLRVNKTSVSIANRLGQTPLDMADDVGHGQAVIRLLLNEDPSRDKLRYRQLNWEARRLAMLCYWSLTSELHLNERICEENSLINRDREGNTLVRVFRRLCLEVGGYSPHSLVPIGIVRYIIKFL